MSNDKYAIVTGSGRGIGRSIALALIREGWSVVLTARSLEELSSVSYEATYLPGRAVVIPGDAANAEDIRRVVSESMKTFPYLDLLVNNAGCALFKPIWELTLEDWHLSMSVNATSAFLFTQEILPGMMARRSGRIINISSVTGIKALPEQGAYCAAKHALNGYTKSLALELRPYNIGVHAICPGGVDTRLSREAMPHRDKSNWMTPDDIAQTVLYLVSLSPRTAVDFMSLRRFDSDPVA